MGTGKQHLGDSVFTLDDVYIYTLRQHFDKRGWLAEVFRSDETLVFPAMGYISVTLPNVTRGPHEHRKQTDHFVFPGFSTFEIILSQKDGKSMCLITNENNPIHIIIPPTIIHQYRNIGSEPGISLNFPDELYGGVGRSEPVDEIRHEDLH